MAWRKRSVLSSRPPGGGFTLLELLMVVIIIGILAAVAIPRYLKTREKARMSEALSTLGQLRSSELRYYAAEGTYTNQINELDFDPDEVSGTPLFLYDIPLASANNFIIRAARDSETAIGDCVAGYGILITRAGTICGTDCQRQVPTPCQP